MDTRWPFEYSARGRVVGFGLAIVAAVAVSSCAWTLFFGARQSWVTTVFVAVVATTSALWQRRRNAPGSALTADQHTEVWRVTRSGQPSGDLEVDQLAYHRLRNLARTPARVERLTLVVVLTASVVLPVITALVRHEPWWCAAAVPGLILAACSTQRFRHDSHAALHRFERETGLDEEPVSSR